ncbi:immunity 52 family protein, partial [Pseudomonas aeruginosa]|nr:immunity 52 family protein [Pseudomonas aeruginosa]
HVPCRKATLGWPFCMATNATGAIRCLPAVLLHRHPAQVDTDHTDFPAATELVDIPGRGTLLLNGREPMDETRREHFERVGEADI